MSNQGNGFPDDTSEEKDKLRRHPGSAGAEDEAGSDEEESKSPLSYEPPTVRDQTISPAVLWLRLAEEPWLDQDVREAAQTLANRIGYSVPNPPLTSQHCDLGWHRLTFTQAIALVASLHDQGVDIGALVAQVKAFPYPDISLEWLIAPEKCIETMTAVLDQSTSDKVASSITQLRHSREFIFRLARLIPPHARLWLRGWADAFMHEAMARAVGLGEA